MATTCREKWKDHMSDLGDRIGQLGKTMTAQFNMVATCDIMNDPAQTLALYELIAEGIVLHAELAAAFNLPAEEMSSKTLEEILAHGNAQGLSGTAELSEAIRQTKVIESQIVPGTCPTMEAARDAARLALNLPNP
jgi:hypothetical protein